jgi:hypothetical protein
VVVDQLFLVLHQQAVELVGKQVDGGIHVDAGGVCVQRAAGDVHVGLGAVVGLLDAQLCTYIDRLVEVPPQARKPGFDVILERGSHFELLAVGFDTHRGPPLVTSGEQHTPRAVQGKPVV